MTVIGMQCQQHLQQKEDSIQRKWTVFFLKACQGPSKAKQNAVDGRMFKDDVCDSVRG